MRRRARFIEEAAAGDEIHIIANHPDERNAREYLLKEREQRADNNIPHGAPVLFLEVAVRDASEFAADPARPRRADRRLPRPAGGGCRGRQRHRRLPPLAARHDRQAAARLLRLDRREPAQVSWRATSSSARATSRPLTHEVLRKAERDPARRPAVHVG